MAISGSATDVPIFKRGFNEEKGSWKTICNRREYHVSSRPGTPGSTDSPSKRISPPVGGRSRTAMRANVDLPHPDSPTKPSVSPRRMESDTPSTARTSPRTLPSTPCRTVNERLTPRKSRSGEEAETMHTPKLKRNPQNAKPENRLAFQHYF